MDPIALAFMLLLFGLALLAVEFFIPSGGMIGIVSGLCILASVFLAYRGWYQTNPTALYIFIISVLVMIPTTVVGTLWIMPRTKFGNRVLLQAPTLEDVTPFGEEQAKLEGLIGKSGKTISMLNPGGMVRVDGERFHCESPGLILDPDSDVEVTGVKGNRLIVCPPSKDRSLDISNRDSTTDQGLAKAEDEVLRAEPQNEESSPLDFEMPQN
jgi:membrane-bound ClpP family serine protease